MDLHIGYITKSRLFDRIYTSNCSLIPFVIDTHLDELSGWSLLNGLKEIPLQNGNAMICFCDPYSGVGIRSLHRIRVIELKTIMEPFFYENFTEKNI